MIVFYFFLTGYQLFLPDDQARILGIPFRHPACLQNLKEKSTNIWRFPFFRYLGCVRQNIQLPFRPRERHVKQIQVVNISLHVLTEVILPEMTICQFRGIVQWCILQIPKTLLPVLAPYPAPVTGIIKIPGTERNNNRFKFQPFGFMYRENSHGIHFFRGG